VGVAELTELLAAVDLDYLLDRHGMHATVDWGAVLSLGACFWSVATLNNDYRSRPRLGYAADALICVLIRIERISVRQMLGSVACCLRAYSSCAVFAWQSPRRQPSKVCYACAGEQQRLGMARLFYHRPRYAILDECTSGVTVDMEERFCSRVKALGCTCITISHRPALVHTVLDCVLCISPNPGCPS